MNFTRLHSIKYLVFILNVCVGMGLIFFSGCDKNDSPLLPQQGSYHYQVAVAGIFQNDARYLKEWIEFHRLVGVEHFYLYNHLSTDDYKEVLKPYVAEGIVDLMEWPYPYNKLEEWCVIQSNAYKHAIESSLKKVKWLAFIDTDEFLFPVQGDNLGEFLSKYEKYAGVCVNWQVYGTSWVTIPNDKLLVEMLTLRTEKNAPYNLHVKSIVRPECVERCINPHYFIYKPGYFYVNENEERVEGPFTASVNVDNIRINHYLYRDEYFLYTQKLPRWEKWQVKYDLDSLMQQANQVQDYSIFRFLSRLKERLSEGFQTKQPLYAGTS